MTWLKGRTGSDLRCVRDEVGPGGRAEAEVRATGGEVLGVAYVDGGGGGGDLDAIRAVVGAVAALESPDADSESGRGLLLVEALSVRWGTERGPFPRKTVWAEVALTGS